MPKKHYAIYQQTLGGMMMVPSFHIKEYEGLGFDLPAYLPKSEIPKHSPSSSIFQLQISGLSFAEANAKIIEFKAEFN